MVEIISTPKCSLSLEYTMRRLFYRTLYVRCDPAVCIAWLTPTYNNRRRELAILKAEPGKNWNSFETFIFVTLRGSSYKINQDPGQEKSGRHFLKPFSIWPTSKIAKIKNKHNFGIINPMKLILVSNSMFLSMIYSLVYLRMHSEFT